MSDIVERLEPLTRQGEDYIWRPVAAAIVEIRHLRSEIERLQSCEEANMEGGEIIIELKQECERLRAGRAAEPEYTRDQLEEMSVIQMAAAIDVAMNDPIPDRVENPFSTAARERRAYARTLASAAFSVIPNFALNLGSAASRAAVVEECIEALQRYDRNCSHIEILRALKGGAA